MGLRELQEEVDALTARKDALERRRNQSELRRREGNGGHKADSEALGREIDECNEKISDNLTRLQEFFNPYWGQILRAGYEESRFAEQVERYACIYMTRVSDLYEYSPKTYFRPVRRVLPHEHLPEIS